MGFHSRTTKIGHNNLFQYSMAESKTKGKRWIADILGSTSVFCTLAMIGYLKEGEKYKNSEQAQDQMEQTLSSKVLHTQNLISENLACKYNSSRLWRNINQIFEDTHHRFPTIHPFAKKIAFCSGADPESDEIGVESYVEEIAKKKKKDISDENQKKFAWRYFYTGVSPDKYSTETLSQMVVFGGSKSKTLADEICAYMGIPAGKISSTTFADGEVFINVKQEMRGRDCFVVIPTIDNDSVVELLLSVSTLRRASAKCITAIIPYFGYARQDQRGGFRREPIAAADIANMLEEMGVDRVIALDLHSPQIQGFFKPTTVVDHLTAAAMIASYFKRELVEFRDESVPLAADEKKSKQVVVVASHEGQVRRARLFREHLARETKLPIHMAMVSKFKDEDDNTVHTILGDVKDSTCIIIDDLVDTASTIVTTTELLKEQGADKVYAFATHARFSSGGDIRIHNTKDLEYIVVTNSIPMLDSGTRLLDSPKIRVISIAPLIGEAVLNISSGSVSSLVSDGKPLSGNAIISEKDQHNRLP